MEILSNSDTDDEVASRLPPSQTGDIQIVNSLKFRGVDELKHSSFVEWWPTVARTVIAGIFADQDARQAAARALMPLLDRFRRQGVTQPRMMTGDMQTLQEMLSSRLMFEEQYIRSVKDVWQEAITVLYEQCSRVLVAHKKSQKELESKAKELTKRFKSNAAGDAVDDTVSSTLAKYTQRLRRDSAFELKLLRAEAQQVANIRRPETRQLDERIEAFCASAVESNDAVKRMRDIYEAHIANIEYEVVEQLREECKSKWVKGLARAPNR